MPPRHDSLGAKVAARGPRDSLARRTDPSGVPAEAGAAAAGVGAAVLAAALAIGLPPAAVAVAALVFAAAAGVALAALPERHRYPRFGLANLVTLVRAGGAAVFAGLVLAPALLADPAAAWAATGAAALLLALDGIDGWAARLQRLASDFGARFDLETDALTILVLAALALALGKAGPWVLALGLMRYAFVAAGWISPRLARPLPASFRRKAVCVLQIAVLAALLAPPLAPPASGWLAAAALAALVASFAADLRWLIRPPR